MWMGLAFNFRMSPCQSLRKVRMQWASRLASTATGHVSCPQLVQRSSATLPVDEPKTALVDAQSRCHRAESQSQLKDLFMALMDFP